MTSKADLERELTIEAKTLRARIAELRNQRDGLTDRIDSLQVKYERECGDLGMPSPLAMPLHDEMCDHRDRLARGEDERKDAEQRLSDLDRILNADSASAAAEQAANAARKAIAAIAKRIDSNAAAAPRWQTQADESFAASQAARAVQVSIARYSLPDDVRAELGIVGQPPAPPATDPGTLEQRGVGFAEAVEQAQRQAALLQLELAAAQGTAELAVIELLKQRAYHAEFEHAIALASYLPILAKFRAAHDVAFGFEPELPAFKRHADESRGAAM